jgi:PAS domain S-box-containing protein
MALSDPAGVVLAVNPAYCALYGFPPEALIGQSFAVIFPAAARAAALQQYQAIFADPAPPQSHEAQVQRSVVPRDVRRRNGLHLTRQAALARRDGVG